MAKMRQITLFIILLQLVFLFRITDESARRPEARAPILMPLGGNIAPNGRVFMTLREPIRANPRHHARVCGRAQCGGAARRSAAEPEVLVRLDGHKRRTEHRRINTMLAAVQIAPTIGRAPTAGGPAPICKTI